MARDGDAYSYPPRGMSRVDAARYIGVSVTKFDEIVSDGRMPRSRRIDSRRVWDRVEVDVFFSDLPVAPPRNEIDAALARARGLPLDDDNEWRAIA